MLEFLKRRYNSPMKFGHVILAVIFGIILGEAPTVYFIGVTIALLAFIALVWTTNKTLPTN